MLLFEALRSLLIAVFASLCDDGAGFLCDLHATAARLFDSIHLIPVDRLHIVYSGPQTASSPFVEPGPLPICRRPILRRWRLAQARMMRLHKYPEVLNRNWKSQRNVLTMRPQTITRPTKRLPTIQKRPRHPQHHHQTPSTPKTQIKKRAQQKPSQRKRPPTTPPPKTSPDTCTAPN